MLISFFLEVSLGFYDTNLNHMNAMISVSCVRSVYLMAAGAAGQASQNKHNYYLEPLYLSLVFFMV